MYVSNPPSRETFDLKMYRSQGSSMSSTPYGGSSADCSGFSTQLHTPQVKSRVLDESYDVDYRQESDTSEEDIIYFKTKSRRSQQQKQPNASQQLRRKQGQLFGPRPPPGQTTGQNKTFATRDTNNNIKRDPEDKKKSRPKLKLDMQAVHRSLASLGPETCDDGTTWYYDDEALRVSAK